MVKPLYTIKEKFSNKEVYIWNVNCDSSILLMKLLFRFVHIYGFVVAEEEYNGESFFNCPVISIDRFKKEKNISNSVIIYDKKAIINTQWLLNTDYCYEYEEFVENEFINPELISKRAYIYGIGKGAETILKKLNSSEYNIEGYLISEPPRVSSYKDRPLLSYHDNCISDEIVIIISALETKYKYEILNNCRFSRSDIYVCFDDMFAYGTEWFPLAISRAIRDSKLIFMCGDYNAISKLFFEIFDRYGIRVDKYIYEEQMSRDKVSLSKDSLYIIDSITKISRDKMLDKLRENNVSSTDGHMSVAGLFHCAWSSDFHIGINRLTKDPLLHIDLFKNTGKLTGWMVLGEKNPDDIKIAILGGSTSEIGTYSMKMWPQLLYEKLCAKNIKSTLYIGACSRATSTHSLIKLIRDGYYIKPDIVISMNGGNNTTYCGEYNRCNFLVVSEYDMNELESMSMGIKGHDSYYDHWFHTISLMRLISEDIGAMYHAFLEPINTYKRNMTIEEKAQFEYEITTCGSKNMYNNANDDSIYINLSRLFHGYKDIFVDCYHITEEGANILADQVLEVIIDDALILNK